MAHYKLRRAFTRAQAFILEPPATVAQGSVRPPTNIDVAVLGLSAGCGTTTVGRGLAQALAIEGERASQVRLIGGVEPDTASGVPDRPSAIVWEVPSGEPAHVAAERADSAVLVAGRASEPSLAELVAVTLGEQFRRVIVVANRVADVSRWSDRPDVFVPESRIAAALVTRGRRPFGAFAVAMATLAELVEGT